MLRHVKFFFASESKTCIFSHISLGNTLHYRMGHESHVDLEMNLELSHLFVYFGCMTLTWSHCELTVQSVEVHLMTF